MNDAVTLDFAGLDFADGNDASAAIVGGANELAHDRLVIHHDDIWKQDGERFILQ